MRNRLVYIGLLVLSLPAIHWGYFIISSPYKYSDTGPEDYIGPALVLILAAIALYGLVTAKPFSKLPTVIKWIVLVTGIIASLYAAGLALLIIIAIQWN